MRQFLALMEGATPRSARPVVATDDPDVVEAFREALGNRLRQNRSKPDPLAARLAEVLASLDEPER